MNGSGSLPLSPVNKSCFTKMKEGNQVMTLNVSNMQRIMQVVQRMVQKSCSRACQLFCCPIDTLLCEKATLRPAQDPQPPEAKSTQVALRSPPSTILIVNISNSTLTHCVIGNDIYPSAVAESRPLMQESALHTHDHMRSSSSSSNHGQEESPQTSPSPPTPPAASVCSAPPSHDLPRISIHGSYVSCAIIGHNNYMHAVQTHLPETED